MLTFDRVFNKLITVKIVAIATVAHATILAYNAVFVKHYFEKSAQAMKKAGGRL